MGRRPDFQVGNRIPCEERSKNLGENLTFWIKMFLKSYKTMQAFSSGSHYILTLLGHLGYLELFLQLD